MPGNSEATNTLYVLDTNTISQIFRSYYQDTFLGFWTRFDELIRSERAISVRAVRRELENDSRVDIRGSVEHLRHLNREFFGEPKDQEQVLVREMLHDPSLSSANNRWAERARGNREDADPFIIAKARAHEELFVRAVVVTQESKNNPANIPAVCQKFGIPCIDLKEMMAVLSWQF